MDVYANKSFFIVLSELFKVFCTVLNMYTNALQRGLTQPLQREEKLNLHLGPEALTRAASGIKTYTLGLPPLHEAWESSLKCCIGLGPAP